MTVVAASPAAIAPDAALSMLQPAAAAQSQPAQAQAPQNLVEYLAAVNPGSIATGASPSQPGDMIRICRIFDRSQSPPAGRALADPTPPPHAAMTVAHRGPAQALLDRAPCRSVRSRREGRSMDSNEPGCRRLG